MRSILIISTIYLLASSVNLAANGDDEDLIIISELSRSEVNAFIIEA